ncbi:MAG: hypothetical protein ABIJ09_26635 [Pseudomonadota bacterium]
MPERPNLKNARQELKRGAWMLRTGAKQLVRQLAVELVDQRDLTLRGVDEVREDLGTWWSEDAPLGDKLDSLRHLGHGVSVSLADQARRLSERSNDLTRATITFTRLQGFYNEYYGKQAYAPFFLAFQEAKAGIVLAAMPAHKRAELTVYAERIRDAQLGMGRKTASYSDCARCERPLGGETGGGCCSSSVAQMFRPVDGLFRRLLGERAPVWPTLPTDFTRCGYMGPRGCVLPAGTRPVICVGFYCNVFRAHLDEDRVWRDLTPEFRQIRSSVKGLEFRFNMHRRFLTGQGQTINDGTVGYLWTKLMSLYASYDQVAPSTQKDGVDALAELDEDGSAAAGVEAAAEVTPEASVDPATGELSYEAGIAQVAAFLKSQGKPSPGNGDS